MSVEVNVRLRRLSSGRYEWKGGRVRQEVTRDEVVQWIKDLRSDATKIELGDVVIDGNEPVTRKRIAEYLEVVIDEG